MPDPYDVFTVAAITAELQATITNGRVQRIGLLDPRTIGAEIYAGGRRHYLIASADDRSPRLRLAPALPSLDSALVTPFGLLLRKYVRGGLIQSIDQPPLERLVRFSIAKRLDPLKTSCLATRDDAQVDEIEALAEVEVDHDNHQNLRQLTLFVELMGRHSNLILVDDDGRIMESAKRVTASMSRVRQVLPRLPYLPPPPPERLDPRQISAARASRFLAGVAPEGDFARALVSGFRGISPLLAREITFRVSGPSDAHGNVTVPSGEALAATMRELFESLATSDWRPHIYRQRGDEEPGQVVAFAPVPMAHLAAEFVEEPMTSVSAALAVAEEALGRTSDGPGQVRHAQRRQRLLAAVASGRAKAERRLTALARQSLRAAKAERLKTWGELIYSHLWQIEPGQRELVVDGETISLDPTLSVSDNAQSYFERYRKAQSAEAQLPGLEDESRAELAYFDQLTTLIAQAPGFSELEALAAEWADLDTPLAHPRSRRKSAPKRPRALVDAAGNSVYIGRSGLQNEMLTFDIADPDDTWLHARGVGGSHVVIRWRTPDTPEIAETIEAAAALAAWYSAARESGGVEVDIVRRRHVRKIKGARPGMVTYRNERTIRVQPAPEEQLREVLRDR